MYPTPREQEKLPIVVIADLVRKRKNRDIRLNHPEAVAYITTEILERAREGHTIADLMAYGTTLPTYNDVMRGVLEMIRAVQAGTTLPDGTKFIFAHDPIRRRLS